MSSIRSVRWPGTISLLLLLCLPVAAAHATEVTASPANGTTLLSSSATFSWNRVQPARYHYVFLGSSRGTRDLVSQFLPTGTSIAVTDLPTDGRAIHLRLWRYVSRWSYEDFQFTAYSEQATLAELSSPPPGSTLTSATGSANFRWTDTAAEYSLEIEDESQTVLFSTTTSAFLQSVSGLPTDGSRLLVRLGTKIGNSFQTVEYSYTAFKESIERAEILTPSPTRLVYSSTRSGTRQIYASDPDGESPALLSDSLYEDEAPQLSPDGTRVVFASTRGGQNPQIYVMSSDGSGQRALTSGEANYSPSWSPDGSRIAFTSNRDLNSEVYVMDANGNNPQNVTNDPESDFQPCWSPDGRELVFVRLDGLYVVGSDGQNRRRIVTGNFPRSPVWSPDGQITYHTAATPHTILRLGPAGDPVSLVEGLMPTYSPDGQQLAFSRFDSGLSLAQANLFVAEADGSNAVQITQDSLGSNQSPHWGIAQLTSTTVSFSWSDTGSSHYYLHLGTSRGRNDLFSRSAGINTTFTIGNLPSDGSLVYLRLWTLLSGGWGYRDYVYAAYRSTSLALAEINTPAPGSELSGTDVTFTWTDTGADAYRLHLGSTPSGTEFGAFELGAGSEQFTVSGLPDDGSTLHVSLGTLVDNDFQFSETSYLSFLRPAAELVSPLPGSDLQSTDVTFSWTDTGASDYELLLGLNQGGDQFGRFYVAGTGAVGAPLSQLVNNLPDDGTLIHVTLGTFRGAEFAPVAYTFPTFLRPAAELVSPLPGSDLQSTDVTFSWTDTGASDYELLLGLNQGGDQFGRFYVAGTGAVGAPLSQLVNNLPDDGTLIHVTLGTFRGAEFAPVAYTFPTFLRPAAELVSPLPGSDLQSTDVTFSWTDTGASDYELLLGLNQGGDQFGRFYVAGTGAVGAPLSQLVNNLPDDGTLIHVTLGTFRGAEFAPVAYTFPTFLRPAAELVSPLPGSDLQSTDVTFSWTDTGASDYELLLGLNQGGDQFGRFYVAGTGAVGAPLSQLVNNLPDDGTLIHVTLGTFRGAEFAPVAYTFPTFLRPAAELWLASGTALPGTDITFIWTDTGASDYELVLGRNPGEDQFGRFHVGGTGTAGTYLGKRVTNLPDDGSLIHVSLGTLRGTEYVRVDSTFTAFLAPVQ